DLAADPGETHDAWGDTDGEDALRDRLLGWIDAAQFSPEAAAKLEGAVLKAKPSPRAALDVSLGDAVKLIGIDLPDGPVRAGSEVDVAWYFASDRALDGTWRPFVHVEGPAGRFLGDHDPVDGAYPVARWRPGQYVVDRQRLRVPPGTPAGEYAIFFGMYQGGQRLPISGTTDNRVRVGTLTVAR